MYILISFVLLVLILIVADSVSTPPLYPSGPSRLPLLGNYLLVRKLKEIFRYHHLVWEAISNVYGNIFSVKMGRKNIVVVSGYDAVRFVLSSVDFDGRPDGFFFRCRAFNKRLGVVFVDGPNWAEQKKFCLQYLRKRGLGSAGMEILVHAEVNDLVRNIRKISNNGTQSINVNKLFDLSVLNGLWSMLTGRRFELYDQKIIKLMEMVHFSFRMVDMSGGILNNMPFLRYFAPNKTGYTDMKHIIDEIYAFLKELVQEHKAMPKNEDDFICAFLVEIDRLRGKPSTSFKEEQLLVVLLDLFLSGSETTSSSLAFVVLHLLEHPDVQAKVYEEIRMVVGNRDICFEDKKNLKYLEAVLMEVQRFKGVAPMSIAHRTIRNTKLSGYSIPKDTLVLASIWSVHMDTEHWGDPGVFRPERFLDYNGDIINDPWFIPFGLGRRRCLGEILAKANVFMFIGKLVQNFEMQIPDGEQLPQIHQDGVTISPSPFSANFIPRNRGIQTK